MSTIDNGIGEGMPFSHSIPVPANAVRDRLKNAGAGAGHPDLTFLYLDCGRWGGNGKTHPKQRNFGLVWGRWAALCDFVTDGTDHPPTINEKTGPLNAFLASLRVPGRASVRVIKADYCDPSPLAPEPSWDHIHVFIPDLHLPVVTRLPDTLESAEAAAYGMADRKGDGPAMGRFDFGSPGDPLTPAGLRWYERYLAGDIFQNAAQDLSQLIELLCNYKGETPVRLVQVGDMYDLWIGLGRYFEIRNDDSVVLLDKPDEMGLTAQKFVDYWVDRANQAPGNADLLKSIEAMKTSTVEARWINGNHDCYLEAHTPASIPKRVKYLLQDGFFAEHGHRGDASNRDGALMGQFLTNEVFEFPFLRKIDPDRRMVFLTTAANLALQVAQRSPASGFCVYVMGHTHSGHLARVSLKAASEVELAMNSAFLQTIARSPFET